MFLRQLQFLAQPRVMSHALHKELLPAFATTCQGSKHPGSMHSTGPGDSVLVGVPGVLPQLKPGCSAEVVQAALYKHTRLAVRFATNILAPDAPKG